MDRRQMISAGAAWAALAPRAHSAPDDLRTAAREAWLYCLPLVEMAGARTRMTRPGGGGQKAGVNAFVHARDLAGPADRTITTPNNDTLYSSAWLDLSAGPVTIALPPAGSRYLSLALMDMFTNNFAVVGPRTTGGEGRTVTVVGPKGRAPADAIRSPTAWAWALLRVLVEGPADLPAARAIQDALTIHAKPGRVPKPGPPPEAAWKDYFFGAQQLLEENPPPAADASLFARVAPLQLDSRGGFARARFADPEEADIQAGVADARALLAGFAARQPSVGGWTYPQADLGDFGQDYLYRAAVSVAGLGALPPAEAMYLRARAPEGATMFNEGRYRLSLPEPLPVDGFWSLTLYEATSDGRLFLAANTPGRYSIGDRTPGLARSPGGGLDIWIGRDDPGEAKRANWLPAPAHGPFALILRAYLPRRELIDGRVRLPPVAAVTAPARPRARRRRRG